MQKILIDSNVILDIFTEDERWCGWSSYQIEKLADKHILAINPIIYGNFNLF